MICTLFIGGVISFEQVGEEEELHHHKEYEELQQYDGPERFAYRHLLESLIIESPDSMKEIPSFSRGRFLSMLHMAANLTIFFISLVPLTKLFTLQFIFLFHPSLFSLSATRHFLIFYYFCGAIPPAFFITFAGVVATP